MQLTSRHEPPLPVVMFVLIENTNQVFFVKEDFSTNDTYYAMIAVSNELHIYPQDLYYCKVKMPSGGREVKAFHVVWDSEGGMSNEEEKEQISIPPEVLSEFIHEWNRRHPRKVPAS